jgi:hypothetical protein
VGPTAATAYSLHDFFNFTAAHAFIPIAGAKYPTKCFWSKANAKACFPNYPTDPDSD